METVQFLCWVFGIVLFVFIVMPALVYGYAKAFAVGFKYGTYVADKHITRLKENENGITQ